MKVIHPVSILFQLSIGVTIAAATAFIGVQTAPSIGAWIGLVPMAIALAVVFRRPLRRWRAVRESFPSSWRNWLSEHLPYYRMLPVEKRNRFERDIQIFLSEQTIEGIAGVDVTDRLRLALASAAAMLLNGHPTWELPDNHTFLIYPANFNEEYLLENERTDASIMGRAHGQGPIIVSLPAVEHAIARPEDGQNVILHELTHLLDFENLLATDLSPSAPRRSRREVERLLDEEMQKIDRGASLLGSYAATNAAEFLAVATERFFERPGAMQRRHPDLYDLLRDVYNQDVAALQTES